MTLYNIGILIMIIFFIALTILIIEEVRNMRKTHKLNEYKLNLDADSDDAIFEILDKIISESFDDYIILNVEYFKYDTINAELEKQICKDVSHKVVERISPALMAKLSIVYNMKNFNNILADKIYIRTIGYSLAKNKIQKNSRR